MDLRWHRGPKALGLLTLPSRANANSLQHLGLSPCIHTPCLKSPIIKTSYLLVLFLSAPSGPHHNPTLPPCVTVVHFEKNGWWTKCESGRRVRVVRFGLVGVGCFVRCGDVHHLITKDTMVSLVGWCSKAMRQHQACAGIPRLHRPGQLKTWINKSVPGSPGCTDLGNSTRGATSLCRDPPVAQTWATLRKCDPFFTRPSTCNSG